MSVDEKAEIERYKGQIKDLMKRVPPSVNSGSHGFVTSFKDACGKANKVLTDRSPKYVAVRSAHANLAKFYHQPESRT